MLLHRIKTIVYMCALLITSGCSSKIMVKSLDEYIAKKQSENELTVLGFIVGESKLIDVINEFKMGNINSFGTDGNHIEFVCYIGMDNSLVSFESSVMGGSENIITSAYVVENSADLKYYRVCEQSKKSFKSTMIFPEIKIGDSFLDVIKKRGPPTRKESNMIEYTYVSLLETKKGQADIVSFLKLDFKNNKLSSIKITKIESY